MRDISARLKALQNVEDMRALGYLSEHKYIVIRDSIRRELRELREIDNMRKADDTERELVKNIIHDVLKSRLKAIRDPSRDGYVIQLGMFIPRELLTTGTISPTIKQLESLKNGLAKLLDDTIQEIRTRNGSGSF